MSSARIPLPDDLIDTIADMTAEELLATYDGVRQAADAIEAMINKPRCDGRAEKVLEEVFDFLHRIASNCADCAMSASEAAPDRSRRAELIIRRAIYDRSGEADLAAQVAAVAARLATEQAKS